VVRRFWLVTRQHIRGGWSTRCAIQIDVLPYTNRCSSVTVSQNTYQSCGPAACNSLPAAVQDLSSSSSCFCSHLKTELLFSRVYGTNSQITDFIMNDTNDNNYDHTFTPFILMFKPHQIFASLSTANVIQRHDMDVSEM